MHASASKDLFMETLREGRLKEQQRISKQNRER
jgi:hypothetical protein